MANENLIITDDIDKIAKTAVDYINNQLEDITPENYFTIALSGGNTPKKLFRHIAENYNKALPWKRIKLFWGDERCVPPESDESNFKMTYDNLIKFIDIPPENIFRIKGENDPDEEACNYTKTLEQNLRFRRGHPSFDLILLGLGEDGHTASIFPDRLDLFTTEDYCATAVHPVTGQRRITITGKIINNAVKVTFLISGIKKAKVVREVILRSPEASRYPAYFVNPVDGKLKWILDAEAAGEL
ncbi:6-phosphogluconolactonase [Melioribacter sp. Ez-97]|uniref:6-phosphogluconolactonase n=1 Tax=Melioribacter sp. Ez-97 TaxID=3423434 RepID=UPI003ED99D06